MPIHNKLVRDCIPRVIEKTGKKFSTRIMSQDEYVKELKKKAFEELEEYMNTKNDTDAVEELADLLEIIHAFVDVHNTTFEKIESVRKEKAKERGGFKERIFLIEVEDE
ncbi:nucleoside triphosphate pyrophosphohydrolase [Neobacillus sp. YIM B06451]|uniref:nucleoside triphosphate pyrophosphohydrolase n=1 Tax=Neobacillus sp. YIM B06451 TaxID=3070994 RepID=UPI002930DDFB|nr:nucleoside triphosphate pyrophosphohydrolase [Neobacillus sp. YIM B06451]